MYITDFFIKRPVFATCINILLLVAGAMSLYFLPTRQFPRSDLAIVTVSTVYIGADAELVRGFVTTPLERAIASADGIDYLESASKQGMSTITAHLRLNYDVNDALTQIQNKVAQVRNDLPEESEIPTINVETSDSRFASLYLSFYSKDRPSNQITDYLIRVVQPKLSAVAGVQKADILGERRFAMRIWLDIEKMGALKVTPNEVAKALRANNTLSTLGSTKGSLIRVSLSANSNLQSAEDFESLVIRAEGDKIVRLGDISKIVLGAESYDDDVRFNKDAATFMGVWVLPNANALEVIGNVRKEIPKIAAELPPGMKVNISYDSTRYIQGAIKEVLKTLSETILIVIIVIFLFIGSLRSVLVPIIAIPVSLIGAGAIMYIFGFTLNQLTLLALVLAVGLVVDDAIVMLENIERHIQEGAKPVDAAIKAARELMAPTIAMTITLAAVYAPIGIQGGLTGALFREFAFTLAGAVLISGLVALTISPVMSSKLLRKDESRFKKYIDHKLHNLAEVYQNLLRRVLYYRIAVLIFASVVILCNIPFYLISVKELAPREDQGVIFGVVQSDPFATLDHTTHFTSSLADVYSSFPERDLTFQITSPTEGFSGMVLKTWEDRGRSVFDIETEAWPKVGAVPGIRTILFTPAPLPGGSDFPVEFILSSTREPIEMLPFADQLVQEAFKSGRFTFADSDLKYDLPQSKLIIEHDKVASMGLTVEDITGNIGVLTGGNYINRFPIAGRSYKVIPQSERISRLNPDDILGTYLKDMSQNDFPVSAIATIKNQVIPRQLNRFQQLNSVKVYGALVPGTTIDQALSVLDETGKKILPPGYSVDYAGESRQLRKEGDSLTYTLLLAFLIIYLVLAAQFESFRDPFIILMGSVPLALAGALVFIFLEFTTLNIYSQIGLVTLVGLIAKNGILIVEFSNQLRRQGMDATESLLSACRTRLRPILMTSVATVAGHFPLIIAAGPGSAARNSIGISLVTGMAVGTIFTLFVVPAIYLTVSRVRPND
jgi:multidrug efflux pump